MKKTYRISIKQNNSITNDPCAICRSRTEPCGVDFFLAGTYALVCDDCARKYAKPLWDVYHRGEAQRSDACSEPDRFGGKTSATSPQSKSARRKNQIVATSACTQSQGHLHPSVPLRKQAYWTILWDLATSTPRDCLLEATSRVQALDEALALANEESGYGPKEEGGFVSVVAYNRADLLELLSRL